MEDTTFENIKHLNPIIQPKYDGWYVRIIATEEKIEVFTKKRFLFNLPPSLKTGNYEGEYIVGTQWALKNPSLHGKIVLFDAKGQDLVLPFLHCPSFTAEEFEFVWGLDFEGVIFRLPDGQVFRQKKIFTKDLKVVGFVPGQGKFKGMLGALICMDTKGQTINVGTGFTDFDRQTIWNNRPHYMGKIAEIAGKTVFDSGSLRHPSFYRWRNDK